MNKGDLINAVAEVIGTKKDASDAVDAMLKTITSSLKKGESVTLVGFGTFAVRERKARKARNPRTGAEIDIPSKRVPAFRPGKELREAVK